MRLVVAFPAALALLAGCYNPDFSKLPSPQPCTLDDKCPEGFQCAFDKRCYKAGMAPAMTPDLARPPADLARPADDLSGPEPDLSVEQPDLALALEDLTMGPKDAGCNAESCAAPTPFCDPDTGQCIACKVDHDCAPISVDGGAPVLRVCCNKQCVDKGSDVLHCGKCGNSCAMGQSCCGGACADLAKDLQNCGKCGNACAGRRANWSCAGGSCSIVDCQGSFRDCNKESGDGCEVNVASDPSHCGACGMGCKINNAVAGCANACFIQKCRDGFANCNNDPSDGCEVNLQSDVRNCGLCNRACNAPPNGTAGCNNAVCGLGGCPNANFKDCDGNPANGCETNVSSDVKNCGQCGKVCLIPPNGAPACLVGNCGLAPCGQGNSFKDCDGNPGNGCETDTSRDVNHCGNCGSRCGNVANGSPACLNSACSVGTCNAPFRDCDAQVGNGCEANTATDLKNCGQCGKQCGQIANGTATCANGACALASCNAPYNNCNNDLNDGCEANFNTDPRNCGKCGVSCGLAPCQGGICVVQKTRVLLVAGNMPASYYQDVQAKQLATTAFAAVEVFLASQGTPTLAQLQQYDVIFIFTDGGGFKDPVALGNVVADYYDVGGRVVLGTFANASIPITGRFGTVANGYALITPGSQESPNDKLGQIVEPNSPLATGVTAFAMTGAYRSPGALVNGGIAVIKWASGAPLIVRGVVKNRNRCDVNFYTPSNFWTGDGAILLRNCLLFK